MTKSKPFGKKTTATQHKLSAQMPEVVTGKKTQKEAMTSGGYAESSARQQQQVLGSVRIQSEVRKALKKAGVTIPYLAKKIKEGLAANRGITFKMGDEDVFEEKPDRSVRHRFVDTALSSQMRTLARNQK